MHRHVLFTPGASSQVYLTRFVSVAPWHGQALVAPANGGYRRGYGAEQASGPLRGVNWGALEGDPASSACRRGLTTRCVRLVADSVAASVAASLSPKTLKTLDLTDGATAYQVRALGVP